MSGVDDKRHGGVRMIGVCDNEGVRMSGVYDKRNDCFRVSGVQDKLNDVVHMSGVQDKRNDVVHMSGVQDKRNGGVHNVYICMQNKNTWNFSFRNKSFYLKVQPIFLHFVLQTNAS